MSFFQPHVWQRIDKRKHRLPECGKCGLFKQCLSPKMKPTGEGTRSVLFVAEAPGKQEDIQGVQLVGDSGQKLRETLQELDEDLEMFTKTNAVICRPPKNKIKDLHIESCRPNLLKTIREVKPHVIILMGRSSLRSLIPTEREDDLGDVARWVGWTIPSREYNAWICPTWHPSYLLRMNDPVLDRSFKEHLRKAISLEDEEVAGEDIEELKKKVECITAPKQARLRLKDLLRNQSGVWSFDYESNRLKPDHKRSKIYACSFSNGDDTFSFMVDDSHHDLMRRILCSKKFKWVASNLKNEQRWTKRIFGVRVRKWFWDTMLAAHVLDNRGKISSLKFQTFIWFGITDYNRVVEHYFTQIDKDGFNKIEECPPEELLPYNGLDSLLEIMVMRKQREMMGLT